MDGALVRCRQREKDSSRRPFWRCVSKNSELFPKAGQTGFLQGITESLVGITVPYLPAFVTLYGKFTPQSYNNDAYLSSEETAPCMRTKHFSFTEED